jgi:hypothetical protein
MREEQCRGKRDDAARPSKVQGISDPPAIAQDDEAEDGETRSAPSSPSPHRLRRQRASSRGYQAPRHRPAASPADRSRIAQPADPDELKRRSARLGERADCHRQEMKHDDSRQDPSSPRAQARRRPRSCHARRPHHRRQDAEHRTEGNAEFHTVRSRPAKGIISMPRRAMIAAAAGSIKASNSSRQRYCAGQTDGRAMAG